MIKKLRTLSKKIWERFKTTILTSRFSRFYKSSHRRRSVRKSVLKNFAKFAGIHLASFLINFPPTLLKTRPWHRCSPVNFARFSRTSFLQNTSGRLLLFIAPRSFICSSFERYLKILINKWIDLWDIARNRGSHRRCLVKKGVLRNFAKFTGKDLCQSFFFNKVRGVRPFSESGVLSQV